MQHGILSYEWAARLQHVSVAMQPVQDRRDMKQVPGGLRLHRYANLYFNARNPMLSARRHEAVCVLSVSLDVLATTGVVITDRNAASTWARFLAPHQWSSIAFDDVLARDWRHPDDPARYHEHKLRMCAEVLVPGSVPPPLVRGAYVRDASAGEQAKAAAPGLRTKVVRDMFF